MAEAPLSLKTVFSGWDGYQLSLVRAIAPLTPEQLAYRAAPDRRSAGEIGAHIAFGRIDWFCRMGAPGAAELGERAAPHWVRYGEVADSITGDAAEIVRWLEDGWRMVERVLAEWTVDDLLKTYP